MLKISQIKSKNDWCEMHGSFIVGLFLDSYTQFEIDNNLEYGDDYFTAEMNGKKIAFMTNAPPQQTTEEFEARFDIIFAPYTNVTTPARHKVFSLCSASYENWDKFRQLRANIKYNPKGWKVIAHMGYPGYEGWASYRRNAMINLVKTEDVQILTGIKPMDDFLGQIKDCRLAVGCPGITHHNLDRSPMQYMSLGCAVVHPEISYPFPRGKLIPWRHYIPCNEDYSDLGKIIKETSISKLKEIGKNASMWFQMHMTPVPLVRYMMEIIFA